MLASLVFEREPLAWNQVWAGLQSWTQDAGGFAAVGLVLWFLAHLLGYYVVPIPLPSGFLARRGKSSDRAEQKAIPGWQRVLFTTALVGMVIVYVVYLVLKAPEWMSSSDQGVTANSFVQMLQNLCLTLGGAFALLAVGLPLLTDLFSGKIQLRRIWALTRLSYKEGIRRRVLWAFLAVGLVFLFGSWFIEAAKPENQVRNYVQILYWTMTPLLLVVAGLLASTSIPTDIKNQTIHTILTKPVERFELIVGRFLGYTLLMSLVLLVMTALSLGYLRRNISPEAEFESLKARVPVYGDLVFGVEEAPGRILYRPTGVNVGHEWEYRSHISGPLPGRPREYAFWQFLDLPAELAKRDKVTCEFSFDVFRTSKARQEGRGVLCSFIVETSQFDEKNKAAYEKERDEKEKTPGFNKRDVTSYNDLSEKYGYYEVNNMEVVDFHTLSLDLPAGLFKNVQNNEQTRRELSDKTGQLIAPLQVRVRCDDRTQYVGMAKHDLYFRLDEQGTGRADVWLFAFNFFKGAFGLWLRLCLVIGLAVGLSTYFPGIIAAVLTFILYLGGPCREFIRGLASGTQVGGGPFQSLIRLVERQQSLVTPLEEGTATNVALASDTVFSWFLRRVLNLIPDVDRFDFANRVSEGFSINVFSLRGGDDLVLHTLLLLAYLVPLALLSYHLMRSREVAST
jgi:hypothetical protein